MNCISMLLYDQKQKWKRQQQPYTMKNIDSRDISFEQMRPFNQINVTTIVKCPKKNRDSKWIHPINCNRWCVLRESFYTSKKYASNWFQSNWMQMGIIAKWSQFIVCYKCAVAQRAYSQPTNNKSQQNGREEEEENTQ